LAETGKSKILSTTSAMCGLQLNAFGTYTGGGTYAKVKDVRVYDHPLAATDVAALYAGS